RTRTIRIWLSTFTRPGSHTRHMRRNYVRLTVKGLEEPFIIPEVGGLVPYAIVEFPDDSYEDILVPLMTRQGTMQDDLGKVRNVIAAIEKAGFDIEPANEVKFSSFTPQEVAVIERKVFVTERKTQNG